MRSFFLTILGLSVLVFGACDSTPVATSLVCGSIAGGCECDVSPTAEQGSIAEVSACNAASTPEGACCADPTWPTSGTCECLTTVVLCGLVSSNAGEVCECSVTAIAGGNQTTGATCFPNGTTSPDADAGTSGTCCMFAAEPGGAAASCACAAGDNPCGTGGTPVDTCSAASFTACDSSQAPVDACK